jgi:hypothetical protein
MYSVKLLYFYEAANTEDVFYQALLDAQIYNIITASDAENIAVEYAQCLAGRTEDDARNCTEQIEGDRASPQKNYNISGLQIAVFGTEVKTGATFTAYGLTDYLSSAGVRSGYVEISEKSRINMLPESSAAMLVNESDESLQVNVFDFGAINQKKTNYAIRFDKFILCAGWQPWQAEVLSQALFMLMRTGIPVDIVFQPAYEAIKPQLLSKHTNATVSVHFAEFAPDLKNQGANKKLFESLMKKWEVRDEISCR